MKTTAQSSKKASRLIQARPKVRRSLSIEDNRPDASAQTQLFEAVRSREASPLASLVGLGRADLSPAMIQKKGVAQLQGVVQRKPSLPNVGQELFFVGAKKDFSRGIFTTGIGTCVGLLIDAGEFFALAHFDSDTDVGATLQRIKSYMAILLTKDQEEKIKVKAWVANPMVGKSKLVGKKVQGDGNTTDILLQIEQELPGIFELEGNLEYVKSEEIGLDKKGVVSTDFRKNDPLDFDLSNNLLKIKERLPVLEKLIAGLHVQSLRIKDKNMVHAGEIGNQDAYNSLENFSFLLYEFDNDRIDMVNRLGMLERDLKEERSHVELIQETKELQREMVVFEQNMYQEFDDLENIGAEISMLLNKRLSDIKF